MNMQKMNEETKSLEAVEPTRFVFVSCSFWITVMGVFANHLPKKHKREHDYSNIWSVEAVEAFKRCFNGTYQPKLVICSA